jgi:ABC-2 type transport system permease protein
MTSTALPVRGQNLAKSIGAYAALAGMVTKTFLALNWSAWVRILQSLVGLVVFVYFWRAVYANSASIAGLALETTLGYIMLARIFQPLGFFDMIFEFGYQLSQGGIAALLVRPLDVQFAYYVQGLANLAVALGRQVPVAVVALLVFRLHWPTDPLTWAVFIVSALIGRSVLFCMDWLFACFTLYTTDSWGLYITSIGLTTFFGGGLVPLAMMPAWLRLIVQNTPFAQSIYVPISLLSGVTPLSQAPRLLLIQLLWLGGMAAVSRGFFNVALRRITIQGG